MASKKKKPQPQQTENNEAATPAAVSKPRLQLVTLSKPRTVVVPDYRGEVPTSGVVEVDGVRCSVQPVAE